MGVGNQMGEKGILFQQKQISPSTPKPIVRKWIISPGGGVCSQNAEVITARKRSLGQGNIFTPVCHSVHRGWVVSQHALQVVSQHALQQGGLLLGGCLVRGVGVPGGDPPDQAPPRTAIAAGGTHPTGMHSCLVLIRTFSVVSDKNLVRFINKINGLGSVHSKSEFFL